MTFEHLKNYDLHILENDSSIWTVFKALPAGILGFESLTAYSLILIGFAPVSTDGIGEEMKTFFTGFDF
jgi:hypothetical protein